MKLLIIGANGFVGSAIYNLALKQKIDVVGTSKHGNKKFKPFDLLNDNPLILSSFTKIDNSLSVIVAAGKTEMNYCFEHEKLSRDINVVAMKRLLLYLTEHGAKTLYFSSDAVFDGQDGNYKEDSALSPLSVYGKQKAEMETWLKKELPQVLIYRLTKLADSNLTGRHLLSDIYSNYRQDNSVRCIEGLRFNPTAVKDVASCAILGLKHDLSGLYNVANNETLSRLEIAKLFLSGHNAKNAKIQEIPLSNWNFKEPKPLDTTLNTEKFQKAVNYKFTTMRELIAEFWERHFSKMQFAFYT